MKKSLILIFAIAFVAGAVVAAIGSAGTAAAGHAFQAAPQAEKAVLGFAPATGTRLTYSVNGQVRVDGKNLLGKDIALNATSQGELGMFIRASAGNSVVAALTSPGIDIQVQAGDKTQSQTLKTAEGKSLEVVFNRTGKVADIRNPEVLSQDAVQNFSIPQILRDYFPVFPAQPVSAGDQWTESRRLNIPFQGLDVRVDLTIHYVLNDIFPSSEGRKAVISANYVVSVAGAKELTADSTGVFEGTGSGTGFLNLLVDRGYFTEYRIDFKTEAAFVVKQGTKRLLEWPFSFAVIADINLVSAEAPAQNSGF